MSTTINPIIPGFAPDPSVVLVDGTYYLVNSTFHLFPGLPIYTSQDLIHWHQIGNAINRTEQLSFSNASTLIHDWVMETICMQQARWGKSKLENFIISSTDIHASKWSDPVPFEFYGIDPSLFFDTVSGKTYMCGSKSPGPSTKITLFEIDVATGEKL
ncbi:Glycoside hydrolase family 43 protein, partial [Pyrenophora tritici-repentis]